MFHVTNHTAKEIEARLKERVVGQETFIRQISALAVMFMNRQNMLERGLSYSELMTDTAFIVGPSGSGKSFVLRQLGEILGIELTVIDCSQLTPSGYKGKNMDSALLPVLKKQEKSRGKSQIVLFDEVDKLLMGKQIDGLTAENSFLVLLDSPEYSLYQDSKSEYYNNDILKTEKIWFLFSGACEGIYDIVRKRYGHDDKRVGFLMESNAQNERNAAEMRILPEDLIHYGFRREMIGRMNCIIELPPLTNEQYRQIVIHGDRSPFMKIQNTLEAQGISVEIDDSAIKVIAEQATQYDTGARAIQSVMNKFLLDQIGGLQEDTNHIVITIDEENQLALQESCVEREADDELYDWEDESEMDEDDISDGVSLEPWMKGELSMNGLIKDFTSCVQSVQIRANKKYIKNIFSFALYYLQEATSSGDWNTDSLKKLLNAGIKEMAILEDVLHHGRDYLDEEDESSTMIYLEQYEAVRSILSAPILNMCIAAVESYEREWRLFES